MKMLLENDADPNAKGGEYGSAIQAATHWGDINIIRLLLNHDANPDVSSGKPS